MTTATQIALIDAKLAAHPTMDVRIPVNMVPNAERVTRLIEASTRIMDKDELRTPHLRRLTRIRELLSRV